MRVAISVIGRFHSFDLAREMHARGALIGIFTGYPRFKLTGEGLPRHLVHSFPYVQAPFMALGRREIFGARLVRDWEHLSHIALDTFVENRMPECDVFVGLSGSALRSGRTAKRKGASYVCDRGSTHIRYQDRLLREEHDRWGLRFDGVDPRAIAGEEAEYSEADCITVPSTFALESFVAQGVPVRKLRRLSYGVDLSRFEPTGSPPAGRFDVLFAGAMSLRKGVAYLLQAYSKVQHPRKSLTFAGATSPPEIEFLRKAGLWSDEANVLGHVPQADLKNLMSRSHVLVLPSVEEGLALVQAQAMACGCAVIASENTGARDLFTDGIEGYIVGVRDADALADRLQFLADHPEVRREMSRRAIARVRSVGGWRTYGDEATRIYLEVVARASDRQEAEAQAAGGAAVRAARSM
jgi:starch synthase